MGDTHAFDNWIHEADLARAIVLAAEQQPPNQILNITDDSPASAAEFAAYVAGGLGVSAPARMSGPAFAVNRMTSEMQRRLMDTSMRVKNDKAKQVLGWTPRHTGFRPGIDQALMVWRADMATSQP
jgi:nucleoside-diphosphate-sugar epimerase